MVKRTLVTAEAVFAAADGLVADGRTPSLRAVRQLLGGGSFGSIGPFLQSWRRSRLEEEEDLADGEGEPLPPAVAAALDRLLSAAREVTEAVQEAARAAHRSDASDAARWKAEIEHLQGLARNEIAALRTERDGLQARLADTEAALADMHEWRRRALHHMKALSTKVSR